MLTAGTLWRTGAIESGPVICPFRLLTGKPCPFCGSTRAVSALCAGDLSSAWQTNPILVMLVPVALFVVFQPRRAESLAKRINQRFGKQTGLQTATSVGIVLIATWMWNIATRW